MNYFDDDYVNFNVSINSNDNTLNINGNIKNSHLYKKKIILAPHCSKSISSFTGSFLPFPCENIAIQNTPNYYVINNDNFNVVFSYPNSYYKNDGFTKIKSPIIIFLDDFKIIYELNDLFPLKTLSSRIINTEQLGLKEFVLPIGNSEDIMYNLCDSKIKYNLA